MENKHNRLLSDVTAHRLDMLEKSKCLTQRQVADGIGMIQQTYSNKKNGIRPFTKKDIVALADFFEVSTDYLLGRIDTPWPDPWEKNGKEAER